MDELVNLIVKKTGIPEATAKTVVVVVIDFLKKKLPAPIASQVELFLNNEEAVEKAEELIGELAAGVKKASTEKKKKK